MVSLQSVSSDPESLTRGLSHPHYLLFCDTHVSENHARPTVTASVGDSDCSFDGESAPSEEAGSSTQTTTHASTTRTLGRWHFVLERLDGPERFEVADSETSVPRDRLALLAVVRGLEALEQPSRVSLVTTSRYVSRGLKYGLETWREADYQWERFGVKKPIRNADLWQRIDQALKFHGVNCKLIQSQFSGANAASQAQHQSATNQIEPNPATETALPASPVQPASPQNAANQQTGPRGRFAHSERQESLVAARALPTETQKTSTTRGLWKSFSDYTERLREKIAGVPNVNGPGVFGGFSST